MYKSRAMKSQAKANLVGGIVGAMGTLYGGMSGGGGAAGAGIEGNPGGLAPVSRPAVMGGSARYSSGADWAMRSNRSRGFLVGGA
jgi:hypothetical protein